MTLPPAPRPRRWWRLRWGLLAALVLNTVAWVMIIRALYGAIS